MSQMKAIVCSKYGPPEIAQLMAIEQPVPQKDELLIKVYTSTVNRTDAAFRSANYFINRLWSGIFRPKHKILGCEFSGVVEEIGDQVKSFKKGDKVFGYNDETFGGHAEYLTIAEKKAVTHVPNTLDFDETAAIAEGAHYALSAINAAKVKPGDKVLVYGASGGIGSSAVQLLKYFGTEVTAVCNTKNVALVQSLGANEVIDYQTSDFTNTYKRFRFIFDAVGKSSYKQCKPLLTNKGIFISTELGKYAINIGYAITTSMSRGKKLMFPIPTMSKKVLIFLKELVESGHYKPVIDRKYNLDQIISAYKYVESGQKTGNVLLTIVE